MSGFRSVKSDVTPLMQAAFEGREADAKRLLDNGANIHATTDRGSTALIFAAQNGHDKIVALLIHREANLDAKTDDGATALFWASSNGHLAVVRALLGHGAGVNEKNRMGATALMAASANGHLEVVKSLLEAGAKADISLRDGRTASSVAKTDEIRALLPSNPREDAPAEEPGSAFSIGDIGPGGGIVFYIDRTIRTGMEARLATQVQPMPWTRTADYVEALSRIAGPGWRLPTIEELELLHREKARVGGFDHDFHWSSSEDGGNSALALVDRNGNRYPLRKGGDSCYVRAVRDFDLDDTARTEAKSVIIEQGERVEWSKHWQYNFDKSFSEHEKRQIYASVRSGTLVPTTGRFSLTAFTVEDGKLGVSIGVGYAGSGIWEIGGATRLTDEKTKPAEGKKMERKESRRSWWKFW
ncbi:MAG TPA: ankyrin repeat domain-containing protein [Reyranella sp.]|nr:ankyrin repeat domain-containing protein [Reyranella sp.]